MSKKNSSTSAEDVDNKFKTTWKGTTPPPAKTETTEIPEQPKDTASTTEEPTTGTEKVAQPTTTVESTRFELLDGTKVFDSQDQKEHGFNSKSELMRWLFDQGMTVAAISHFTGNHYSFVHGVISSSREIVHTKTASKSDEIRSLHDQGKKVGEIAKLLNANYSFVFGVIKKYKASKEVA